MERHSVRTAGWLASLVLVVAVALGAVLFVLTACASDQSAPASSASASSAEEAASEASSEAAVEEAQEEATQESESSEAVQSGARAGAAANVSGLSIDDINEWLNTSANLGPGSKANSVAIIPIRHVNGPKEWDDFYAFVSYKYKARAYIKYQVTYISCTCRSAEVNYWQTAYVELTLPESGNIEDAKVRTLSFDYDTDNPEHQYLGGHWGDSSPTPGGATYDNFKNEYIPYFIGKDKAFIDSLTYFDEDIDLADYQSGEGRSDYTLDVFTGSSVSANNIFLMLQALFEFHATDDYFTA